MRPIFIIEHLEPQLWPWCLIEYKSISNAVGKEYLWFTNIASKDKAKLSKYGKVIEQSIKDLPLNMDEACVLDPLARKILTPKEAPQFTYYIFGGILGEEKLNGRTKKELTQFLNKAHKRHLGKGQFSTDNAVYITDQIIKGKKLADIPQQHTIEIPINKVESVILPYNYPLIHGKPRISQELITYLRNKKDF